MSKSTHLPVVLLAALAIPLASCDEDQPSQATSPSASAPAPAATPAGPQALPSGNQPPIAIFKVTPDPDHNGPRGVIRGTSPFTVKFNMCASHDKDGDEVLYTHDFDGDGIDELKGFGGTHCRRSFTYVFSNTVKSQRLAPRQCLTDTDRVTGQHLHPKQCQSYVVAVLKK